MKRNFKGGDKMVAFKVEKFIVSDVIRYRNQSVVTIPKPHKPIWTGDYIQLATGQQLKVERVPLYDNPKSVPVGKIDIVLDAKININDVLYY